MESSRTRLVRRDSGMVVGSSKSGGKDREDWAKLEFHEALGAEALLLGRRSYEYFAAGWSSRPGEWADRLRSLPKYVVSSTPLGEPDWKNAHVLGGSAADEISTLKKEMGGEIVVYGSRQLVRTLMNHDLVDEFRLTVYPVVLGTGDRLFDDIADKTPLRLARRDHRGRQPDLRDLRGRERPLNSVGARWTLTAPADFSLRVVGRCSSGATRGSCGRSD